MVNFSSATKINALVKSALQRNAETKENNTISALGVIPSNGTTIGLNSIIEGIDYNQRIGRTITSKNIQIDLFATAPAAGGNDAGFFALVYDSQPNSGIATFATIFDITAAQPGQAFKSTGTGVDKRFRVCWMEHFAVITGSEPFKMRKFWKCQDPSPVQYNQAPAVAPITGAYILCVGSMSNTGVVGTSSSFSINARYQFTDL
jgi:hypothetical protein